LIFNGYNNSDAFALGVLRFIRKIVENLPPEKGAFVKISLMPLPGKTQVTIGPVLSDIYYCGS